MKRFLKTYAAIGAALAGAAWIAGPALSLERYAPEPEDFSQTLPAIERLAAAARHEAAHEGEHTGDELEPVRFRSPPIRAPRRFDLVGVAASDDFFEYRVRRDGERWSRWIEVDEGNPLYAGGADWVQVLSRHSRPRGRLHYVNVSGSTTGARRLLTGVRGALNSALLAVAGPAAAQAQGGISPEVTQEGDSEVIDIDLPPPYVSRSRWGADEECAPRTGPVYGEVRAALVHHTVTANDYSAAEAPGIVLGICRFHRNGNSWNDIGYNFLVDRFGKLYEGRAGGVDAAAIGAHASGYNSYTTSISSIGTHTSEAPTATAVESIADHLSWKLSTHGVPAHGQVQIGSRTIERISGHRDVNPTGCPGEGMYARLGTIRARTVSSGERQVQVSLRARPGAIAHQGSTVLTGRATAPDTGRGLGRVRVQFQRNAGGAWRSFRSRRTDRRGNFRLKLRLTANRDFRVAAAKVGEYRSGSSGRVPVPVRPRLSAGFAAGSSFRRGGVAIVRGRVQPRKRVDLLVSRRGGWRSTRARTDSAGRFEARYRFPAAGSYRFRVTVPASRNHAAASSRILSRRVRR